MKPTSARDFLYNLPVPQVVDYQNNRYSRKAAVVFPLFSFYYPGHPTMEAYYAKMAAYAINNWLTWSDAREHDIQFFIYAEDTLSENFTSVLSEAGVDKFVIKASFPDIGIGRCQQPFLDDFFDAFEYLIICDIDHFIFPAGPGSSQQQMPFFKKLFEADKKGFGSVIWRMSEPLLKTDAHRWIYDISMRAGIDMNDTVASEQHWNKTMKKELQPRMYEKIAKTGGWIYVLSSIVIYNVPSVRIFKSILEEYLWLTRVDEAGLSFWEMHEPTLEAWDIGATLGFEWSALSNILLEFHAEKPFFLHLNRDPLIPLYNILEANPYRVEFP